LLEDVFGSLLPTAVAHGLVTDAGASELLAGLDDAIVEDPRRPVLWPLLLGAWKRKAG
jgi:hypothetical protein